jgi:uncharacterized alpha/beta hydrolase family protein
MRWKPIMIGLASVLLCIAAVETYLILHSTVGNDVLITLGADKQNLYLEHGAEAVITFKVSVSANPFCEARCVPVFEDLSRGTSYNGTVFELETSHTEAFSVRAVEPGFGEDLYRMQVSCVSEPSTLCKTDGKPVRRSILVTVDYGPTENEIERSDALKSRLNWLANYERNLSSDINWIRSISASLGNRSFDPVETDPMIQEAGLIQDLLARANSSWMAYSIDAAESDAELIQQRLVLLDAMIADAASAGLQKMNSYNSAGRMLIEEGDELRALTDLQIPDYALAAQINATIARYDTAVKGFKEGTIPLDINTSGLREKVEMSIRQDAIRRSIADDILWMVACAYNISCSAQPTVEERLNGSFVACSDIEASQDIYGAIKGHNDSEDVFRRIANATLDEIPRSEGWLRSFVRSLEFAEPEGCIYYSVAKPLIFTFEPLAVPEKGQVQSIEAFFGQPARCCMNRSCGQCCSSGSCQDDYPIIFVHGHSMDKDTSFEHSIDSFIVLQESLESDGYIDAGTLASYAPLSEKDGSLSRLVRPVSIRASYYFDEFYEPSVTLVQTKSENIDTYAVRLNEIVKSVKQMTGKPKVILVAHSMGGLVSRRYLQVFGVNDVDRLVMIGTPNHGINGTVGRLCAVTGSELECRDMQSTSLFINKLNREKLPKMDILNIVGTGCQMDGSKGDGIVLESSALLGKGDSVLVGTCEGEMLHSKLLEDARVYELLRKDLS